MDPISQLGRDAYHALCVAFAAQNKDKLYAPETDVLLEEARELLGISEDDDSAIRAQIEKDPMIASLRRGEPPPGGIRALTPSSTRATTPYGGGHGGMPPPSAGGGGMGGGYDTPFGNPMQQKAAAAKKPSTTAAVSAPPPGSAGGGASASLVGRKLQRLFPDLSPPWVTGTIVQYNPVTGKHLIQYGPPLRKELWDCVEEFAPGNFKWVEPGSEPAGPVGGGGGGGSKAGGGGSKTGGGSKSSSKATTPRATPAAPKPATPVVPPPTLPALLLPGGPSTFHATGVSLTAAPYNDGFLRTCIGKNRIEDLATMLSSIDDREVAVVRDVVALLDDPGDVAELNRLLEESQQLGQREQQLRLDLRELGVTG